MKQIVAAGKRIIGERSYELRIDRSQSPLRMRLVPIISVMLGSMAPAFPFFPDGPLLPPLGFMIFLGWRLMRPGMWPAWIGLPFGLFDDLYNGLPFGSAGLMWSLMMLTLEFLDSRAIWRDHLQDWLIAAVAIFGLLFVGMVITGMAYHTPKIQVILPQLAISILLFPLVVRFCARLDRWRLAT